MKRTAIIILKDLNRGQASNVAAILAGQVSLLSPNLYDTAPVLDSEGQQHAAIRFSVVLLDGNSPEQLANFAAKLSQDYPDLITCVFSKEGQTLNNEFDKYKSLIGSHTTAELMPVGIIVSGEDERVRLATKKFSLAK